MVAPRKAIRALLIAIAAGVAPCVALQPVGPPTVRAAVDVVAPDIGGRYLVEFKAGSDPNLEAGRLEALGVDVAEVYTSVFDGVAVRLPPSVVDVLRNQPFVRRVEADQVLGLDDVDSSSVQPTTVQTGAPWGLDRLDQRSLPLSSTYSYNSSGTGVTAYIIDSGIFAQHTDFGGRVRSGFTTVADGLVTGDCNGHGTHVAGIVGGQTSGVAKGVSLVAVRVLDCTGSTTVSQLLDALDWVIADHQAGVPAVANISIGGPPSSLLDAGVQALINDGVTVAVAAGNSSQDACLGSPAQLTTALTVAASTENDARASFSNFGPCVDLFAPGVNIPSAGIASTTEIVLKSGTSMAAPHVAGAAAVLLSERPTWTPAQVARDLAASATVDVVADPAGSPNQLLFASPNAPPGNDQFDSAATIDLTLPTSNVGTNVDASTEPGEPAHGPSKGGTSVWWTFTAPEYGTVTISTEGSTFDTMLAVYTGSTVSALTAVGSNDGPGNGSNLTIRVEAGRAYHVAVDGGDGASGTITVAHTWTPAPFVALVPARLLESRAGPGMATTDGLFNGIGVRSGGSVTELTVTGRGGVAANASAVVLTVTVTQPVAAGFVTVFPCGTARPLASNVNFAPAATVANTVVSGIGTAGRVCLFTNVDTDLVVDVDGYFP